MRCDSYGSMERHKPFCQWFRMTDFRESGKVPHLSLKTIREIVCSLKAEM